MESPAGRGNRVSSLPAALFAHGAEQGWFEHHPNRAVRVLPAAGEPLARLGVELPAERPGNRLLRGRGGPLDPALLVTGRVPAVGGAISLPGNGNGSASRRGTHRGAAGPLPSLS
ncbi:hypothetical protein GCM10017786_18720 [Amycolatopsis deserti]|uniref:Uncharacterized protein n=1 Tax=Amycolatopsis deserti TaxID=185696 RepID=A0ABQ3INT9_9PSEU|nr:hypothetical protein GCM10017786_18720 [Amycolatopsis deserti]